MNKFLVILVFSLSSVYLSQAQKSKADSIRGPLAVLSQVANLSGPRVTPSLLWSPWPSAQMSVSGLVVEDFVRGALYVGFQKKVFRSVDSGVTWTELSAGTSP